MTRTHYILTAIAKDNPPQDWKKKPEESYAITEKTNLAEPQLSVAREKSRSLLEALTSPPYILLKKFVIRTDIHS